MRSTCSHIWKKCHFHKISNKFLILLDRHFAKPYRLHKTSNQDKVKTSYGSMPYFRSKKNSCIKKIHKKILKPSTPSCTCRVISSWPLNGDCLQSSLFYICKENTPIVKENQPHNISLKENNFNFINLSKNLKILKNYYFFIKKEM